MRAGRCVSQSKLSFSISEGILHVVTVEVSVRDTVLNQKRKKKENRQRNQLWAVNVSLQHVNTQAQQRGLV